MFSGGGGGVGADVKSLVFALLGQVHNHCGSYDDLHDKPLLC